MTEDNPPLADFSKLPDSVLDSLIDIAMEVSRKQVEILLQMEDALLREDTDEVLKCAKQLCGIEDWQIEEYRKKAAKVEKRKQRASKAKTKK